MARQYEADPSDIGGVGTGLGDLNDLFAQLLSDLTAGNRARILTEALVAMEYTDRPAALRRSYERHEQALEEYFSHIDMEALIETVRDKGGEAVDKTVSEDAPIALAGFAAGALITGYLSD